MTDRKTGTPTFVHSSLIFHESFSSVARRDPDRHPVRLQLVSNPGSLSLGSEFDAAGNLVALSDGNQSEPALWTYAYDGLDRLTAVCRPRAFK